MRILLAAAFVLSIATPQGTPGSVKGLTSKPTPIEGGFYFTVEGTNPCTQVFMDFGDGTSHTYTISSLPDSSTIWHHYTRGGTFTIRAAGAAGCTGEAFTRVSVNLPTAPPPATTPAAQPATVPTPAAAGRFPGMDRNGDAVVSREEWQGSANSFRFHDWNNDGILSGDEVRIGAARTGQSWFNRSVDWSASQFLALDTNRNGQISRAEWRYTAEDFYRVDRDRNNVVTREEFLIGSVDDDRGDRFADLDVNGDNRIGRDEWHGSDEIFRWLDLDGNNWLSLGEVTGDVAAKDRGATSTLGTAAARRGTISLDVSAKQAWTDTGIDVRAGDILRITATGTIGWANDRTATAPPAGATSPATAASPMPGRGIGALVGRVGDGPIFLAATATGTVRVEQTGRLYLGVNDDVLTDNSGAFRVTVAR